MFPAYYRKLAVVVATAGVLALGGCADLDTVKNAAKESGTARSFTAPYDEVTAATLESIRQLDVGIAGTEEKPEGLVVLVSKPLSAFSYGEVGRVLVERSPAPPTNVRIVWEKRYQLQISGTGEDEFSREVFTRIGATLAQAK